MKRTNDYDNSDGNKKPRFSQSYNDMYAQYSAMDPAAAAMMMNSQYAAAGGGPNGFGGFASPNGMYGAMGYGVPGSNMGAAAFNGGFGSSGYPHPAFAAAAAAMGGGGGGANGQPNQPEISRTIYLGNIPDDIVASNIFDTVRVGPVESLKFLMEKSCAFLTFVDPASAQLYYQQYLTSKLVLGKNEIKVGWGKYTPRENLVQEAIKRGGSRNVYIGQIDDTVTEETLKYELAQFGMIDQARVLREKNIAFVHFASIASATKCITTLPNDPNWKKRRINYGKDRCSMQMPPQQQLPDNKQQQQQQQQQQQMVGSPAQPQNQGQDQQGQQDQYNFGFQHPMGGFGAYGAAQGGYGNNNNVALRTLYLGSISAEATCEDLCNVIRGGVLFQIRYMKEKHIAFVTFVDPMSAVNLYNHANTTGLVVKGRRLKVGWGKPTNMHSSIYLAVQNGASRNIYVGGIKDKLNEEKLRKDFEQYGEIEMINTLSEKNCAFVNFTNIQNAMKALGAMKYHADYKKVKINYGKDRCGNPFKRPNNASQQQQHQQQHHQEQQKPQNDDACIKKEGFKGFDAEEDKK
ncbi:hypothetical protein BDB00DRAFT_879104 [Zychaea mexicana]|uniref:uncharacterized protein n=1 Tax=Zychaea mexicana TaxID=64656 RepID=UPI0022FDCA59|nr:uncharacterized protein BDB00DRAFT_879104 [Zychaea mexicana]KAI9482558.1 hypothetical protein BDB00DRAFT_879104 [Zychaea mexicana]